MLDCLILGDSIAVGTAHFRPECAVYAKSGINSHNWLNKNVDKNLTAKSVIISLGSNDHSGIRTIWELQQLRAKVEGKRVFWIMPAIKPDIQNMVRLVAEQYGDTIIPITKLQPDGVHPSWSGYKEIVEKTK